MHFSYEVLQKQMEDASRMCGPNFTNWHTRLRDLMAALTMSHLALSEIGSRIQNDRGVWKIRRPHDDMFGVTMQINEAMAAYHAVLPNGMP